MNHNKITVVITGGGGGVGQSIIKALKNTNCRLVGLDASPLACGLYTCDKAYLVPLANDPAYIKTILKICQKEKVQILFPGLDLELLTLAQNSQKFQAIGTTVIVSQPKVIQLCDDKLLTAKFLLENNILAPKTGKLNDFLSRKLKLDFPIVVKQKNNGSRSLNVFTVKNRPELDNLLGRPNFNPDHFVAQEYISGDEYTCGAVNLTGKCQGIIIMRRTLRNGDTYTCFSVKNPVIEKTVLETMNLLKPFGACNVQLRLRSGQPYIFEINPRCSGTTAARAICGFNEPKMIIEYLVNKIKPKFKIKFLSILRYWNELVVENSQIAKMTKI